MLVDLPHVLFLLFLVYFLGVLLIEVSPLVLKDLDVLLVVVDQQLGSDGEISDLEHIEELQGREIGEGAQVAAQQLNRLDDGGMPDFGQVEPGNGQYFVVQLKQGFMV